MVTNNNRIVEIHFEVKIKHASDAQTHDLQGVPQKISFSRSSPI